MVQGAFEFYITLSRLLCEPLPSLPAAYFPNTQGKHLKLEGTTKPQDEESSVVEKQPHVLRISMHMKP